MIPLIVTAFLITVTWLFTNQPKFGKPPFGERLERIKKSKQYKNGKFENSSYTPDLTEGANFFTVLMQFFLERNKNRKPKTKIPTQKIDLIHLDSKRDVLVWFGHSSYFIQLDGKTFLIDPVFSGTVSPISVVGGAFAGADVYKPVDFPDIDYLLISHDHWDHLDYETVLELKHKVKQEISGLVTGSHLEYWGYDADKIIERDWHEMVDLGDGFSVT
ncbi:MAG: MBL fold metallo-hydrolase, partial [Cytophagales bacterium]